MSKNWLLKLNAIGRKKLAFKSIQFKCKFIPGNAEQQAQI